MNRRMRFALRGLRVGGCSGCTFFFSFTIPSTSPPPPPERLFPFPALLCVTHGPFIPSVRVGVLMCGDSVPQRDLALIPQPTSLAESRTHPLSVTTSVPISASCETGTSVRRR